MTTTIPAGWMLVPIEPTDDMETAAVDDYEQSGGTYRKSAYAAMLAAAPAVPAEAAKDTIPVREKYEYALARLGLRDSAALRVIFWDAFDALQWEHMTDTYITPMSIDAPVPVSTVEQDEQAAFERWFERTCPSGDVETVRRQWEASSDYDDFHAPAAGDALDVLLLTQALQGLRQAFVLAVGDKSPFARMALEKADAALAAAQLTGDA